MQEIFLMPDPAAGFRGARGSGGGRGSRWVSCRLTCRRHLISLPVNGGQILDFAAERFTISGELSSPGFVPWVERHARRLGLAASVSDRGLRQIKVRIEGPAELVDAMEVGCLLGPIEVWVDDISREPLNSRVDNRPNNRPNNRAGGA